MKTYLDNRYGYLADTVLVAYLSTPHMHLEAARSADHTYHSEHPEDHCGSEAVQGHSFRMAEGALTVGDGEDEGAAEHSRPCFAVRSRASESVAAAHRSIRIEAGSRL